MIGGPLDASGFTEVAISALVAEHAHESELLEFKGGLWAATRGPRPAWTGEQEFAKDVAAFANHRGGVIVVGIGETGAGATSLTPIPAAVDPAQEERRLRQALLNYQSPLAACEFVWAAVVGGGWYCAVVIPPSPRSPHAVLGGSADPRVSLRYPVRHGADATWLGESEVAGRYRRRLAAQEDESERTEAAVRSGARMLARATGVWLYVCSIPESPVAGHLDVNVVRDIEDWHRRSGQPSPLDRHVPAYGRGIPAPGKVTFTGSLRRADEDETEIRDAYVELHVDGSTYAATPILSRSGGDGDARGVGEITLVDDGILLVDLATRWTVHRSGAWGTATLVIGFVDSDTSNGALGRTLELVHVDSGSVQQRHGTRRLDGDVRSLTIVDLAAVGTLQQRLAVAYQALSGLFQWFGLAEPPQLRSDGTIVARQFGGTRYRQVEKWATEFAVAVERLREN